MSGSFSVVSAGTEPGAHDHYDLVFAGGKALRFTDPRKFGSLLWGGREPLRHKLLADLGPEPFSADFGGAWLKGRSLGRRVAVKSFLMMPSVVAGMGNIYASEALYRAGIHPRRAAGRIALHRYEVLAGTIREVLGEAIEAGGTTLRDFADARGRPGYFAQQLDVMTGRGRPAGGAVRRSGAALSGSAPATTACAARHNGRVTAGSKRPRSRVSGRRSRRCGGDRWRPSACCRHIQA